jgi:hypothetical protein
MPKERQKEFPVFGYKMFFHSPSALNVFFVKQVLKNVVRNGTFAILDGQMTNIRIFLAF